MHISEITVRRPVLAAVISMFLVLIGLVSYDKLSIREYPDIDKPVVTVSRRYLKTHYLESQILRK
jgi:multidrug efflux pump